VGLAIFSTLLKYIGEWVKNMGPLPSDFIYYIPVIYIIMGILELPLIVMWYKYKWYKEVMRIMDVEKIEETVFKSLYPLELNITDSSFRK